MCAHSLGRLLGLEWGCRTFIRSIDQYI